MIETVGLLAAATLFGGMAAFSFLFAPLVFAKLPAETAGAFIRAVFPWYYLFVLGVAAVAAAALALAEPWPAAAMAGVAIAGVVARQILMPAINAARDRDLRGDARAGRRFAWLHRGSVVINLVQMAAAGWALAALAP